MYPDVNLIVEDIVIFLPTEIDTLKTKLILIETVTWCIIHVPEFGDIFNSIRDIGAGVTQRGQEISSKLAA